MKEAIDKLAMLVRMRGRERDRREQALIAERREHDRCLAELRAKRAALTASRARHQTALRARAEAPGDMLLADYLQCEQTALHTLAEEERQAGEDVTRSEQALTEARTEHQRAQMRLEALEDQLAKARRQEQRRLARKQDAARPEHVPGNAVMV